MAISEKNIEIEFCGMKALAEKKVFSAAKKVFRTVRTIDSLILKKKNLKKKLGGKVSRILDKTLDQNTSFELLYGRNLGKL